MNHNQNNFKTFYALSFAWQLGFIITVPIAGFLSLGLLLDNYFNTEYLFLIVGLFTGLIITFYEVYHMVIPLIKEKKNE